MRRQCEILPLRAVSTEEKPVLPSFEHSCCLLSSFLIYFCDLWCTGVPWLDKIGWLPKTDTQLLFLKLGLTGWLTLILNGACKIPVWNSIESCGVFNGGFCAFGIKTDILGMHLFMMISLVSEQNLSDWQVILTQVYANGFPVYKAG